ncbi:hypothetical protein V5O48_002576 [Marasmius crinis-equi]|uniref:FAD-binding PCMH-type domain-containing protein n=1 Tax=Marasmius crinis-equi TaxID=585013 RepID=A0ABR3FVR0_9AGAR
MDLKSKSIYYLELKDPVDWPYKPQAHCHADHPAMLFGFSFLSLLLVAVAARNPKRGLAYPTEPGHAQDILKADGINSPVSWMYTWDVDPRDVDVPRHIEFVPMQWGTRGIEGLAEMVIGRGYKNILAFNEPELPGQSNIRVEEAARLWKTFLRPLKTLGGGATVRLGSPAVSSAPQGKDWLKRFFELCGSDCGVDFIAMHWYGEGAQNFINYMHDMHATFPRYPIWVTEFGCTSGSDQGAFFALFIAFGMVSEGVSEVKVFLNETLHFLDSSSWVERYAWFAFDVKIDQRDANQLSSSWSYGNALSADLFLDLLDIRGNLNALGNLLGRSISANLAQTYGPRRAAQFGNQNAVFLLLNAAVQEVDRSHKRKTYIRIMDIIRAAASDMKPFLLSSFYLATSLSSRTVLSLTSREPNCRCLYGDSCWPSNSDFDTLPSQLSQGSQGLIHPTPPEAACYPPASPSGNCTDVQLNTLDGNWRSDRSGAYQNINFETFVFPNGTISACYLNTTIGAPCEQGGVPPIGVDARTVGDVQVAVRFASERNLRLVVKNTGHDFLGRSAARNSFMVWTHHLKNITYDEAFVPEGAPSSEGYRGSNNLLPLTLGAGVQWHEAYDAAEQHGRFVVGGISVGGSVGAAGGWVLGGGHSAWSPSYGLGVDNVLQFTVVVASGDHLTTNSHTNPDLFWALRGGGGGTYGIVTSVTYRTHDPAPGIALVVSSNFSSTDVAKSIISEYFKTIPTLADARWGGYTFLSKKSMLSILVAPNADWAEANETIKPFVEFAGNKSEETSFASFPFPSFYSIYSTLLGVGGTQSGTNQEIATRLFPRKVFEDDHEKVADAVISVEAGMSFNQVTGGFVSSVDPDSVGVNPAWRDALAIANCGVGWKEGASATEIETKRQLIKSSLQLLESLNPGGGTYFNEASLYESNPAHTFFGNHYDRLLSIKDQYDPHGLFVVAEGVGSERWDGSLNCRK